MSPTEYREIPDCPGYRVGSDGTVWSRKGRGNSRQRGALQDAWTLLKFDVRKYGHAYVTLRNAEGERVRCQVHHLVLEAFVGPRPEGHEGCHGDGDASNNAVSNLRWGTHAENMADRARHGTLSRERHGRAVLTEERVSQLRLRHEQGCGIADLAREFDVSESQARRIVRREQWK